MTDLRPFPEGWVWTVFDQIAKVASDLIDPAPFQDSLHIAPNHIEPFTGRLMQRSSIGRDGVISPKQRFTAGQLLYSKIRPYLGKAVIAPDDGLCSADMYPIRTELEPRYLMWWLLSAECTHEICQHQGRSLLPKINQRALSTIAVPLAPLDEQIRIVDELERRLSHVDAAVTGLRSAQRRLAAVRKAILLEAVPEDVPSDWTRATVADAGTAHLGLQRSPSRHTGPNMKPYLKVANVFEDRIDLSSLMEMDFTSDEEERYLLRSGDILLNEGQSPEFLGRPAMWLGQVDEMYFTNSLIRFRSSKDVMPEWALLVFRRHMHAGRFRRESRITTNIAHLALGRFRTVEFPIPSLDEQMSIVTEVERRLSLVDVAWHAVEVNIKKAERLRRSLVSAAFRGELVTQNPTDESAIVLLERIRAQQEAATTKILKSRTKKSKERAA